MSVVVTNKEQDNIALVDMDGTLADYDGAMKAELARLQSPEEPELNPWRDDAPSYLERRRKLVQSIPGFWRNLAMIRLGFNIYEALLDTGFDIHILTKGPGTTPSAWSEKFEWCRNHVPEAKITITQDKSIVYGRVLVDDWPSYFEAWLDVRPRGLVICVAQPWNAHVNELSYKYYDRVLRYDGTNFYQIKAALELVKNRAPNEVVKIQEPNFPATLLDPVM